MTADKPEPSADDGMSLAEMLKLLAQDMKQEKANRTIARQRAAVWRTVGDGHVNSGHIQTGLVAHRIADEVALTGVWSDESIEEYKRLVEGDLGPLPEPDEPDE
jgi:hypothetical protein